MSRGGGGDFNVKWRRAGGGLEGRFDPVYIKAEISKRGQDKNVDMELAEFSVEPDGIIDVDVDEARSTPKEPVMRAKLTDGILQDPDFYEKIEHPVKVEIVARPVSDLEGQTATGKEFRRTFTVGCQLPDAEIHWKDLLHPEKGDDPTFEVEADGEAEMQLEVWMERWLPAERRVGKDDTIYFSHRTGKSFPAEIFGPHPESLPWIVAQPGSGNRRDRSRWMSKKALPDPQRTETLPLPGHIRVRAWGPKQIISRGPDEIEVVGDQYRAQAFVPVNLVGPRILVRKIGPTEPCPADDAPTEIELEFSNAKTGEPVKTGTVSWKLKEGASSPGGTLSKEEHTFTEADGGRVKFDYHVPRLVYEPGRTWDQDFEVFSGTGQKRVPITPGVKVWVSPEIRATITAEKKGIAFAEPYQLIVAAHLAPCEIVGHIGFASKHPDIPDQLNVFDAKPKVKVQPESGEREITIEGRTAEDGTFHWHLPELVEGLKECPESRRKLTLTPFEEGCAGDLDETGQRHVTNLLSYLRAGDGPALNRLLSTHNWEVVLRQPLTMARHLCKQLETEHEKAWLGTVIVNNELRGAVFADELSRSLFNQGIDLILKFLVDAVEVAFTVFKVGERVLKYLASTRIGGRIVRGLTWAFEKALINGMRLARSTVQYAAPNLALAIDAAIDAITAGGAGADGAIRTLIMKAQETISVGMLKLIAELEAVALNIVMSDPWHLTSEALKEFGADSAQKVIKKIGAKVQEIVAEAGKGNITWEQAKDAIRDALSDFDEIVHRVVEQNGLHLEQFEYPNNPDAPVTFLNDLLAAQAAQVDFSDKMGAADAVVDFIDGACDVLLWGAVAATVLTLGAGSIVTFPTIAAAGTAKLLGQIAVHLVEGFYMVGQAAYIQGAYEGGAMRLTNPAYRPS